MGVGNTTKTRYLDFYMKCWRLVSMGSRNDTNVVRYWSVFVLWIAINSTFTAFMYRHIFIHASNIDGIAEVVDFATLFTAGLFRYIHALANGREYDELARFVEDNFKRESFAKERKLTMDKYVKRSKIVNYSYMGLTCFWVTQVIVTRLVYGMVTSKASKPYVVVGVDMPYDECTQLGKGLTYAIHYTSYYITLFIYWFSDTYWFAIIMLTTAQFELISHSLRSLTANDDELQDETDFGNVERVVTSCLYQHQILRRCIRMMENLLSPIVLVDFLHAITSITFILFDMTIAINQQSPVKALNLVGYLLLSVGHMWIMDYFGDQMTVKEEDISKAIYEIPWYKYPKKIRTEIILMIILSSHPHKLTGGKLFRLSLEFFGKVTDPSNPWMEPICGGKSHSQSYLIITISLGVRHVWSDLDSPNKREPEN